MRILLKSMTLSLLRVSLVIVFLLFSIPIVGANRFEANGTTYYQNYDGTYTTTPAIISSSPLGYQVDWAGVRYFKVWDNTNKLLYDTLNYNNGTFISPWIAPHLNYWRTTGGGSWREVAPVSNEFEQQGNNIISRTKYADGEWINTTTSFGKKIKYSWELNASQNRNYSLVFRIDSAARQDMNADTKKYTPGFLNNFTYYDWSDYGNNNVSTWLDINNRKFYQRFVLGTLQVGQRITIDPGFETNGSTTPAWNNTKFDGITTNSANDYYLVEGDFADYANRPNSTNMGSGIVETGVGSMINNSELQVGSTGFVFLNTTTYSNIAYKYTFMGGISRTWLIFYLNTTSLSTGYGYMLELFNNSNSIGLYYYNATSPGTIDAFLSGGETANYIFNTTVTVKINSTSVKIWYDDIYRGAFDFRQGDTRQRIGYFGFYLFGSVYRVDNIRTWNTTARNATFWGINAGAGNYISSINISLPSNPENTNLSLTIFDNSTGTPLNPVSQGTGLTAVGGWINRTVTGAQYQIADINVTLYGNLTATAEIARVIAEFSASGAPPADSGAIPPNITVLAQTNSSTGYWINYTWQNGTENTNITNSFNVSVNGTWTNGSITNFSNGTVLPHGWRNITVWAFNSSGNGNLSNASVSMNTQIPNNVPVQSGIGAKSVDEGSWLNFSISSTDLDGDDLTYATNATKGTLTTKNFNWSTTYSDSGTYYWIFNTTDNYSTVATETVTITVNNVNQLPPTPVINSTITGNFYINTTWTAGSGNVTNGYNSTNGTTWVNNTLTYRNTTLSAHGWQNLTIYAWNSTDNTLSSALTNNTQIPNNAISISGVSSSYSINEGQTLNIDADYTDTDGDTGTFDDNATQWSVNSGTGIMSWTTGYSDDGTYNWLINVTDGYGSTSTTTFVVTVTDVPQEFIPPTPIIGTVTTGNFFKNLTWTAGVGNVTNTYNVSRNGTWFNGTATFLNTTTVSHGWINDTIYAFNSSGTGTLNTTGVTNNTQVPNNVPIQLSIGDKSVNEGTLLSFTISSTDSDGDALTYGSNNSKGILTDNSFSWTPTYSDSGTYTWYFNTTDNYSAVATETITITVNNVNQIPPVPVINTVTNGTSWVNQSWTAGVGNVTDSYNVSVNGTWTNGTTTTYKNTTGISANGWANLTVWAWNNTDNVLSSTALTNNTQTTTTTDTTPPASITDITNTTTSTSINWTWTNPADSDFNYTSIYLNGSLITNTSNNYYLNSSLTASTTYTIGTHTVDTSGNVNTTWVNQTTTTTAAPTSYNLSGIVTNKLGAPVLNALISIEGGGNDFTNDTGYYLLENIEPSTLAIKTKAISYKNTYQTVDVSNNTAYNIVLKEKDSEEEMAVGVVILFFGAVIILSRRI